MLITNRVTIIKLLMKLIRIKPSVTITIASTTITLIEIWNIVILIEKVPFLILTKPANNRQLAGSKTYLLLMF